MKKILFTFFMLLIHFNVNASIYIKIDNDELIPYFNENIKKYNYYTDKDNINIVVVNEDDDMIFGEGMHNLEEGINKFIVSSSKYGDYEINVYKNYIKKELEKGILTKLEIANYNINFNKDIYEYNVAVSNDNPLDINYEVNNPSSYVEIIGNGNFNKTKNIITINVDNINTYKINVYKTDLVSHNIYANDNEEVEMSYTKKEIAKLLIITISCSLVFSLYYILFIKKLF